VWEARIVLTLGDNYLGALGSIATPRFMAQNCKPYFAVKFKSLMAYLRRDDINHMFLEFHQQTNKIVCHGLFVGDEIVKSEPLS
jgi:hypothetical protein